MATKQQGTNRSTTRLYVGNLSQTIDEYSLMQLCSKFGKISKLDYLFHKTGPQKGKPRGYAFVEYSTKEEAKRAIGALHDKLIRGRKLSVTPASEQTTYAHEEYRSSALTGKGRGAGHSGYRSTQDAHRPSTISLLKGGQGVAANASTDRKIAALEAKLASIRQAKGTSGDASGSGSPLSGEQWLDSLTPPGGPSGSATPTSTTEETDQNGTTRPAVATTTATAQRRIVDDLKKAGLPAKPMFDAAPPLRKHP